MPCPVMRGELRFMLEGSGESAVAEHAGDGAGAWWCKLCGADCWMTSDTHYFSGFQWGRAVAK